MLDLFVLAVTEGSVLDVAQNYDALEIINRAIAYAIIVAGFLSVVFIFFGGISFILSGGQEEKIKQAVSTIRYAIIGLVVTLLAVVIVGFVGNALGLNVVEYINLGEIFDLISELTNDAGGSSRGGGLDRLE
jgi:cytochrome bd-type quinol oxidase subunit 2